MSTATPPGDGPGEGPEEPREDEQGPQPAERASGQTPDRPSDQTSDRPSEHTPGRPPEQPAPGPDGVDVDAAWAQIMAHWNEPAVDPGTRSPARPGRHRRAGHEGGEPPAGPQVPPHELRRRRTDRPADRPSDRPMAPPAAQGPSSAPPPQSPPPAAPSSRAPRTEGGRPGLPDGRGGTESDPLAEEHYVPPEPPPLPRGSWRTWLPWVGVLGVPLFFVVVVVLRPSLPSEVVLVAVLGFVAGFLTLVLRLPDHRDDDGDDGARV
ncbi:hypothetical protein [Quadrisphaera sp. INWT6]|uniref:hypothetical protein n=1 Tax=Quadrisphaera sp. INWT6 TaxID=2596917 RepID=UPI0018927FEA|nr:hypothetical protein [Quadrisphaera sp. INWT6]MBF5082094.1 hypothetical protein [Quadrisphaera sp. INWT6]